jgi:hypothetical protein
MRSCIPALHDRQGRRLLMTTPPLRPEIIEKLASAVYPAFAMVAGMQLDGLLPISVAERSFSLLDHVQMFVKPMPQLLLCRRWELQDKTRKTQSLEDFKIAPSIRNDMRASAA